MILLEYRTS